MALNRLAYLTVHAFGVLRLSEPHLQHAIDSMHSQCLASQQWSTVLPCRDTTSRSGAGLSGTVYRQDAGSAVTAPGTGSWTRGSAAPIIVALGFLSAAISAVAPFSWVSQLLTGNFQFTRVGQILMLAMCPRLCSNLSWLLFHSNSPIIPPSYQALDMAPCVF